MAADERSYQHRLPRFCWPTLRIWEIISTVSRLIYIFEASWNKPQLGALRAGVADVREVQGGDQEVLCSSCYVRLVEGDDATWLAELREAQRERPLGLFGKIPYQG